MDPAKIQLQLVTHCLRHFWHCFFHFYFNFKTAQREAYNSWVNIEFVKSVQTSVSKMPRGTLEVVLISAKGIDDNDFLCKHICSICIADKKIRYCVCQWLPLHRDFCMKLWIAKVLFSTFRCFKILSKMVWSRIHLCCFESVSINFLFCRLNYKKYILCWFWSWYVLFRSGFSKLISKSL